MLSLNGRSFYKRGLVTLLAMVLMLAVALPMTATASQTATIAVGPINLRQNPSESAKILAQFASGAEVAVIAKGNVWTQVKVGSLYGYMLTQNLTFAAAPAPVTPKANATIKTHNGGNLNLRDNASTKAAVIASFANGTRVQVVTHGPTWCKVVIGNHVGHMLTSYLTWDNIAKPVPAPVVKGFKGVIANSQGAVVNLRKTPSLTASAIKQLPNGTAIIVTAMGKEWMKVSFNGLDGYILAKYVKVESKTATFDKTVNNPGTYVNLRQAASLTAKVLKQVDSGAAATVLIPYGAWSKVVVKDGDAYLTGYMMSHFLK